jgi:hypothetical protein
MMGRYTFSLDSYEIRDTRSLHEDTNYVTVGLNVNGQTIGSPPTKFMGDQNNGKYPVGLSFPNVEVPDGSTVIFNYQILNSGHQSHADIEKALQEAAVQQLTKAHDNPNPDDPTNQATNQGNDNLWAQAVILAIEFVIGIIFANCDGIVASRPLRYTSNDLRQIPIGQKLEDSILEHGSDSAVGCGGNSRYVVRWSITRLS